MPRKRKRQREDGDIGATRNGWETGRAGGERPNPWQVWCSEGPRSKRQKVQDDEEGHLIYKVGDVLQAKYEIKADLDEGADMIMVKPAVTYLDIIAQAREITDVPIGAYHVSGEYSMIKAAGGKGWIDEKQVAIEQLTAVKRSGANFILTYFAKEIAECL